LSAQDIEQKLIRLEKETKSFKEELFRISWYMRGGISVNDLLYNYSYEDREMIYNVINENLETVKTTGLPLL